MAWIYLFIASLLEVGWTISLKLLDFGKLKNVSFAGFFSGEAGRSFLLPLLGYIFFGLANTYFFSLAMKNIPASTALAIWLGVAMIGIKIIDTVFFHEPIHLSQVFCFLLILAGVMGLKSGI
jgi:quaternary ammonium compound-resistance protein SugE